MGSGKTHGCALPCVQNCVPAIATVRGAVCTFNVLSLWPSRKASIFCWHLTPPSVERRTNVCPEVPSGLFPLNVGCEWYATYTSPLAAVRTSTGQSNPSVLVESVIGALQLNPLLVEREKRTCTGLVATMSK